MGTKREDNGMNTLESTMETERDVRIDPTYQDVYTDGQTDRRTEGRTDALPINKWNGKGKLYPKEKNNSMPD